MSFSLPWTMARRLSLSLVAGKSRINVAAATARAEDLGDEALPLEARLGGQAEEVEDRRGEVQRAHEPVDLPRSRPGDDEEERNPNEVVPQLEPVAVLPVLAERLAVVRAHDDRRPPAPRPRGDEVEEAPDVLVRERHLAVVSIADRLPPRRNLGLMRSVLVVRVHEVKPGEEPPVAFLFREELFRQRLLPSAR